MTLGIIMMVHSRLDRAEQLARHWLKHDCPVVIHVDQSVPPATSESFMAAFADEPRLRFCPRHRCEWGTWGLVAAALSAAEVALESFPDANHLALVSGSCLPLRPVAEFKDYLAQNNDVDFIESVNTLDVKWTMGGLEEERFDYHFPFAWKSQRALFDYGVRVQRHFHKLFSRKRPDGLLPHLGSQWWCLTRRTLQAILTDERRPEFDRYFRHVWIPDESYFQTLARHHSRAIESRSLTLSKFDHSGRPHVFYDDHLSLLRRSDCFLARKIWPDAEHLYRELLRDDQPTDPDRPPRPEKIDRIFSRAYERRIRGRAGLYMAGRFPTTGRDAVTARGYSVFSGFEHLFTGFDHWLSETTGARVHGHLFDPKRVQFAGNAKTFNGAMSDSAALRDYNPNAFLTNLIWNARGERQALMFGPRDNHMLWRTLAADGNAQISLISGAFFLELARSKEPFKNLRLRAARLQQRENEFIRVLRMPWTNARVRIWTLGEFLDSPRAHLQEVIDEIAPHLEHRLSQLPPLTDLAGFPSFLQQLKNTGLNPYLAGEFHTGLGAPEAASPRGRLYPGAIPTTEGPQDV